jgi:predicted ArsR family transcriptional regulator
VVTVENNDPRSTLGPAPVQGGAGGVPLSRERAAVLDRLRQHDRLATVGDLAAELGGHPNTVREHLDGLVEQGLVTRERGVARGRGRPAWRYTPAVAEPDPRVRDYAGLATALAGHLERVSADPGADALEVGRGWGRELATGSPAAVGRAGRAGARHRVVDLLGELGFDPRADPRVTTVALRRCPLLDAARRHPQVVCQVHLGIVRGALEVYRGDPDSTELLPFAEPGACRLHLRTAAAPGG